LYPDQQAQNNIYKIALSVSNLIQMKSGYYLLLLSVLLYAACVKKDSAAPATKPPVTADSAVHVVQLPVKVPMYPYTDTFTGYMQSAAQDETRRFSAG